MDRQQFLHVFLSAGFFLYHYVVILCVIDVIIFVHLCMTL